MALIQKINEREERGQEKVQQKRIKINTFPVPTERN
jgi:hypothetical protein